MHLICLLFAVWLASHVASAVETGPPAPSTTGSAVVNSKDVIDRAQKLLLQKERGAASQLLVKAIQSQPRNSSTSKDLLKSLEQLTTFYITEKGQLIASYAKTLVNEKPKEAIDQFQEALKHEPNHVGLLRDLSRGYLALGECSKASPLIRQLENLNPFSGENRLLVLQELECSGEFDTLSLKLNGREPEIETVETSIRPLQVEESLHRKDTKKAALLLSGWEIIDSKDPELHRWKWEVSLALARPDRSAADTYLRLCRALTSSGRQKYGLNPLLCRSVDRVVKDMQKHGTESGELK